MNGWKMPLDPECPKVAAYLASLQEGAPSGAPMSDFYQSFTDRHRGTCKRCQEFGAENVGFE